MFCRRALGALILIVFSTNTGWSAAGTEGASFLDIPVGGAPAALGSAYTAQANDAYAPVWNPAGLGTLHTAEFTGMHLSYLGPIHYEHAGFVVPIGKESDNESGGAGIGGSIQYLGTGSLDGRDEGGTPTGSFTSAFAAYTLSYGQKIADRLSVGASAKLITEKISDASAQAYAADAGLLYRASSKLRVGAVIANVGSKLKFVDEADPLPLAGRLGATYRIDPQWDLSVEGVYRETGMGSGSLGVEWRCGEFMSVRTGYNTAHTKTLGFGSGITAGAGLFFWGQEFSYAFVPVGDLGQTHYFSLVFRLSKTARPDRPMLKKSADEADFDELNFDDKPLQ